MFWHNVHKFQILDSVCEAARSSLMVRIGSVGDAGGDSEAAVPERGGTHLR